MFRADRRVFHLVALDFAVYFYLVGSVPLFWSFSSAIFLAYSTNTHRKSPLPIGPMVGIGLTGWMGAMGYNGRHGPQSTVGPMVRGVIP
jgi:hypothetical protein